MVEFNVHEMVAIAVPSQPCTTVNRHPPNLGAFFGYPVTGPHLCGPGEMQIGNNHLSGTFSFQ